MDNIFAVSFSKPGFFIFISLNVLYSEKLLRKAIFNKSHDPFFYMILITLLDFLG